ncbi:hypothetical protein LCGC14_1651080 [marine sediment metagenome]|uniref:Chaperonin GroEL n=1 Tax=marine sediment metagenome TaxID=412755 RepID=A0A0F9KX22_9ZZZZ
MSDLNMIDESGKPRSNQDLEDALHATRAAVEEGILPGGGVAYIRAIDKLKTLRLKGDESIGVDIVRRALSAPLKQIAENAGANAAIVAENIANAEGNKGFDATSGKYCDMVKEGIVDPTKVVRTALINASSIATLLLTTDALIGRVPEKKKMPPAPSGGGGYGGYGDMY